ncbi:MAG: hypothetical protein IPF44_09575 [Betaproteobacteria bacterium]|nr:hypothetical protein [Betaproteobacteria bacterium]
MPLLFLTAPNQVEGLVKELALGADDCLVKPFAISELLACSIVLAHGGENAVSISDQSAEFYRRLPRGD